MEGRESIFSSASSTTWQKALRPKGSEGFLPLQQRWEVQGERADGVRMETGLGLPS